MANRLLLLAAFLVAALPSQAQFFTGLRGTPYAGITNVNYNPAIAGSPWMVDINVIAIGANVNNNYVGLSRYALYHPSAFSDTNFQQNYMHERVNGLAKSGYAGLQVQGPLSFMFQFGPKSNRTLNAIGFSYHGNFISNVDNVTEVLARTAYHGLGYDANNITHYVNTELSNANLSIKSAAWIDYGITYSRVVINRRENQLKVGGTLKLLQPVSGAYGYVKNLSYKWTEYEQLNIYNTQVNYAYNNGMITSQGNSDIPAYVKQGMQFKNGPPTVAVDLGAVYEWRPDATKPNHEMDCKCIEAEQVQRYKIAAGFAIMDFGALRFKRGDYSRNFTADIRNWDVGGADFPDGLQSIDDTIQSRFKVQPGKKYFTVWLPTRFNLFVDYNIWKDFSVNFTALVSQDMSPKRNMLHQVTTFSVIPRYEIKWFGAYVPLSVDVMGNVGLGLTLRAGPLIIGTQDLLGLFVKKHLYNADIHAGLKINIPYHRTCPKNGDIRFSKKG